MHIGKTLRKARSARGWTQQSLARRLGISTSYLGLIEQGKRVPSDALVQKMLTWMNACPVRRTRKDGKTTAVITVR